LQGRGLALARFAFNRYEVTVQTGYDIGDTSTAKAVARWEEIVSAVLLQYRYYFVLDFLFWCLCHALNIVAQLD